MRSMRGQVLVVAMLLAGCSSGTAPEQRPLRTIDVQGVASVFVSPDRVTFTVGVDAQDMSVAKAFEKATARMAAVIGALESSGVQKQEMQTSRMSVRDVRDRDGKLIGREASSRLTVTRDDLTNAGALLQAAIDAGATDIDSLKFLVRDRAAAIEKGLELAFQDAQQKAEKLAELSGASLGRVVTISDNASAGATYERLRSLGYVGDSVAPGLEELSFNVYVRFELE